MLQRNSQPSRTRITRHINSFLIQNILFFSWQTIYVGDRIFLVVALTPSFLIIIAKSHANYPPQINKQQGADLQQIRSLKNMLLLLSLIILTASNVHKQPTQQPRQETQDKSTAGTMLPNTDFYNRRTTVTLLQ